MFSFGSSEDLTGRIPGLVCQQLDAGAIGNQYTRWAHWFKLARLIESLPP